MNLAHSLNIEVTNTPEVLTDDVADIALGLMLCVARQLCYSDRYVRAKRWPKEGPTRLTSKVCHAHTPYTSLYTTSLKCALLYALLCTLY